MSDIYKAPEADLKEPSQPGEYGSMEKALSGDYELHPIEVIKTSWDMLKGMKTTYWLAALAYLGVYIVVAMLAGFGSMAVFGTPEPGAAYSAGQIVSQLVITLVMGPLAAGLYMIPIKYSVGAKIEAGELFRHFDKMIPLFVMTILLYITVAIGLILLVIPGIYLMVGYVLAIPLMVEKNMGPWEALNTSRKAITHKWFHMFGFLLVVFGVLILGSLALVIGLLWAVPLVALATAVVYRDMFGVESSTIAS